MAKCKNKYELPIRIGKVISWSKRKSPAHVGYLRHSLDFDCLEGTEILAARKGIVVWIRDDSNKSGPYKKYWDMGNRIVIKHENGEYSAYEHLRYKGVVVKVGEKVKLGQLIGFSGNTGYISAPHLHFEVFNNPHTEEQIEGETLQVVFYELRNKSIYKSK